MLFGEVVEPQSRALIVDDEDFIENSEKKILEWKISQEVPSCLRSLIVVETGVVLEIFHSCVLFDKDIYCESKNGEVKVYKISNEKFAVILKSTEDFCHGEIVEELRDWLINAEFVINITSAPIASYISTNLSERPECLIRSLAYNAPQKLAYEKLESPNLVTNFGAAIFSYRVLLKKSCSLYVIYLESVPLDSIISQPILELIRQLDVGPIRSFKIRSVLPNSNLYM